MDKEEAFESWWKYPVGGGIVGQTVSKDDGKYIYLAGHSSRDAEVSALKDALMVRINFRICPDCKADFESGFDHAETCRFYAIESQGGSNAGT